MITGSKLIETLDGESSPKCNAANGGIACGQPVVSSEQVFPSILVWFCQTHSDERESSSGYLFPVSSSS